MSENKPEPLELRVDHTRVLLPETGIFVRAIGPEKIEAGETSTGASIERVDPASLHQPAQWTWGSWDIVHLTQDSLQAWLRSRGGENEWAESVVYVLLGHR